MADASDFPLDADGLHELAWDACDSALGGVLVASPADAQGRGILLAVTRGGEPCDLAGANAYLVWRHREARRRGCEPFEALDAAAGRFRVFYPSALAGAEGTVDAQVMVSWGDRSLSSRTFCIHVEQELVGGDESPDGFGLFIEAIKKYEQAAGEVGDVAAEAREAAGEARKVTEGLLASKAAGEFDGCDGVDGLPGRDGADGKDGAPGRDGAPGKDGAKGEKGDAGERGPKGDAFTFGDFTADQLAALKGPKGDAGPAGATGPAGETGPQGPRGETGPAGPQGETGATGPQGPQGEQGPKGDKGDDATGPKIVDIPLLALEPEEGEEDFGFVMLSSDLNVGDCVIDFYRNLCQITSKEAYPPGGFEYTAKPLALLRGSGFKVCEGFDVDPGKTTGSISLGGTWPRTGDYVLSADSGCLGIVSEVEDEFAAYSKVVVKGVNRLGVPDLSAYATKEYVDGKLAEIASLEEMTF